MMCRGEVALKQKSVKQNGRKGKATCVYGSEREDD